MPLGCLNRSLPGPIGLLAHGQLDTGEPNPFLCRGFACEIPSAGAEVAQKVLPSITPKWRRIQFGVNGGERLTDNGGGASELDCGSSEKRSPT
jgi:hypothetical protein